MAKINSLEQLKTVSQRLYDRYMDLARVGTELRDRYQVYSVRSQWGVKLAALVDTRLNPAITPLMRALVRMTQHSRQNKAHRDLRNKGRILQLSQVIAKRIRKLKPAARLPVQWRLQDNQTILGRYRLY